MNKNTWRKTFLNIRILYPVSAAFAIYLAWFFCESSWAPVFGWCGATLLSLSAVKNCSLKQFFIGGCLLNLLGFYWVADTVSEFGDLPKLVGDLLLVLFVLAFALQWPLAAYISKKLSQGNLSFPAAYVAIDFLFPKIFPWSLGHTQLDFPAIIQVTDILGVPFIVFIMLWTTGALLKNRNLKNLIPAFASLFAVLLYGYYCLKNVPKLYDSSVKIIVAQANITPGESQEGTAPAKSQTTYSFLTAAHASGKELVIWPESSLPEWFSYDVSDINQDMRLPRFSTPINLLLGTMTFKSRSEFYNSALALRVDGTILKAYNKRILMPFGEYIPFSSFLPFLKNVSQNIANFTPGTHDAVFSFSIEGKDVRVSPLICYEDVIPSLARESVQDGANLLVNLTNDVWFGKSLAAKHHHQIAAFRSIENRRTLVRSTNTGLTAVVNPLGETIAQLPMWKADVLEAEVPLVSYKTFYTQYIGGLFWWILSGSIVFFALLKTKSAL